MLVKLVAMVAAWFDTDRSIACAMRRAPADCLPFSFPIQVKLMEMSQAARHLTYIKYC